MLFFGLIGAGLNNLKAFWKMSDSHLLKHSPFSGRKRIGLGDWRQILTEINLVQRGYALHAGSRLASLHRQAELGFGATIAGRFDPEDRELTLGRTGQAVTVGFGILEH